MFSTVNKGVILEWIEVSPEKNAEFFSLGRFRKFLFPQNVFNPHFQNPLLQIWEVLLWHLAGVETNDPLRSILTYCFTILLSVYYSFDWIRCSVFEALLDRFHLRNQCEDTSFRPAWKILLRQEAYVLVALPCVHFTYFPYNPIFW